MNIPQRTDFKCWVLSFITWSSNESSLIVFFPLPHLREWRKVGSGSQLQDPWQSKAAYKMQTPPGNTFSSSALSLATEAVPPLCCVSADADRHLSHTEALCDFNGPLWSRCRIMSCSAFEELCDFNGQLWSKCWIMYSSDFAFMVFQSFPPASC